MELFGIGPGELLLILVLALIFIGPGKMPEVAASIGKAIREFQRASAELSEALNAEIAAAQAEKAAKQLGENGHSVEPAGEAAVVAQAVPEELAPVDYASGGSPIAAIGSEHESGGADVVPTTGEASGTVVVPTAPTPEVNGYTLDPLPESLLAPSQPESGVALVASPTAQTPQSNGYALDPLPQSLLAPSQPEPGPALIAAPLAAGGSPVAASLPAKEREMGDAAAETVPGEAAVEGVPANAGNAAGVETAPVSAADTPEVVRQAVAGGAGQAEVQVVKVLDSVVGSFRDLWRGDRPEDEIEDQEMTILEHLEELRSRIVKMAIALLVATAVALIFTPRIMEFLKQPAPAGTQLIFIEVTEMFVTYFKVALVIGVGLSMPVQLYQIIRFVAPGLTRGEKRLLFSMLPLVGIFFFLGATFGYFVTLPFALRYLLGLFNEVAVPSIRIGNYIGFVTTILFWMGISFELPVVIYTLARIRLVTPRTLSAFRKYAILIFFIVAAIITPTPDPLNQTLVAVPMIVLYELGILMARTVR